MTRTEGTAYKGYLHGYWTCEAERSKVNESESGTLLNKIRTCSRERGSGIKRGKQGRMVRWKIQRNESGNCKRMRDHQVIAGRSRYTRSW